MNQGQDEQYRVGSEILKCPHCGEAQEDTVDDYVVPGRVGSSSATQEQCDHCDKWFEVECVASGQFTVRPQ